MLKVKGIYDGTKVVLLDPLPVPPQTVVEVLVAEQAIDAEQVYWQQLVDLGLVRKVRSLPANEQSFEPIQVTGAPVSQTILEERR